MVKEADYMKFLSRHFKRCLNIQKNREEALKNTFDWNRNNIQLLQMSWFPERKILGSVAHTVIEYSSGHKIILNRS